MEYDPRAHARNADPGTSAEAAAALAPEGSAARLEVPFKADHYAGGTGLWAREAGRRAGMDHAAATKRASDLHAAGAIRATGTTERDPETGRRGVVFEWVPPEHRGDPEHACRCGARLCPGGAPAPGGADARTFEQATGIEPAPIIYPDGSEQQGLFDEAEQDSDDDHHGGALPHWKYDE